MGNRIRPHFKSDEWKATNRSANISTNDVRKVLSRMLEQNLITLQDYNRLVVSASNLSDY